MPYSFAAVLNYKLPTAKLVREVSLDARRYSAKELYDLGTIDVLAENGTAVLKAARELAMERADLAKQGVWGLIKVSFELLQSFHTARSKYTDAVGFPISSASILARRKSLCEHHLRSSILITYRCYLLKRQIKPGRGCRALAFFIARYLPYICRYFFPRAPRNIKTPRQIHNTSQLVREFEWTGSDYNRHKSEEKSLDMILWYAIPEYYRCRFQSRYGYTCCTLEHR